MYENDSEDEEEDEAEMLQPNPKLEQGESFMCMSRDKGGILIYAMC